MLPGNGVSNHAAYDRAQRHLHAQCSRLSLITSCFTFLYGCRAFLVAKMRSSPVSPGGVNPLLQRWAVLLCAGQCQGRSIPRLAKAPLAGSWTSRHENSTTLWLNAVLFIAAQLACFVSFVWYQVGPDRPWPNALSSCLGLCSHVESRSFCIHTNEIPTPSRAG